MFIKKIDMVSYKMGSFDTFIIEIEKLLKDKYKMTDIEIDNYLAQLEPETTASIVDKNGYFIGFIGTRNTDLEEEKTDIVFEVIDDKCTVDKKKILETYKTYLSNSLNIHKYDSKTNKEKKKPIIFKSKNVILNSLVDDKSGLYLPASLLDKDKTIGVIGLSNLSRSDMSADLNISLNCDFSNVDSEYLARLINEYITYIHKRNIWNINCLVGALKKEIISALEESDMNYYGTIPFADISGDYIGNLEMFQHVPRMIRRDYQLTGNEIYIAKSIFRTDNDTMRKVIPLYEDYKMVRTDTLIDDFKNENLLFRDCVCNLALAMCDRRDFSIPLKKDKYFPVLRNNEYGVEDLLKKSSYIVLSSDNQFVGFLSIVNDDNEHLHCEIEVGVIPEYQKEGFGKEITDKFCQELFSLGYASITFKVLDFNKRGNYLFNRIATLNGKRVQSYYTDGKLCDMNIYTKLNPLVEKVKIK